MDKRQPGLTFDDLRIANIRRLPQFKNKHGDPAHSRSDGSDWSPAQWLGAVIGELGEYANFRKKFERGDLTFEEFAEHAAKELADVQTYLDILALRCLDVSHEIGSHRDMATSAHPTGINLGDATIAKFNEVSERVGADVFLDAERGMFVRAILKGHIRPGEPITGIEGSIFGAATYEIADDPAAAVGISKKTGEILTGDARAMLTEVEKITGTIFVGSSAFDRCGICGNNHDTTDCDKPE